MTTDTEPLPERVGRALRRAGLSETIVGTSVVSPIISPMGRATDWICLRVKTDQGSLFVKLTAPDRAGFINMRDAAAGARTAAALGIAPELTFFDDETGVMAFDLLQPPWREARLGDLSMPHILEALLAAKRRMHRAPPLDRVWDVFAEIHTLASGMPNPPDDLPTLLAAMHDIHRALDRTDQDIVPCHADGVASNVMIGPDDALMLVDFDCAGMADSHYDIGIVLNEVCAVESDWAAAGAIAYRQDTGAHIDRCRLYAVADDLLWGLWGLSTQARSTRTDLEFLKYGFWRLLRCRAALGHPDHIRRLRTF